LGWCPPGLAGWYGPGKPVLPPTECSGHAWAPKSETEIRAAVQILRAANRPRTRPIVPSVHLTGRTSCDGRLLWFHRARACVFFCLQRTPVALEGLTPGPGHQPLPPPLVGRPASWPDGADPASVRPTIFPRLSYSRVSCPGAIGGPSGEWPPASSSLTRGVGFGLMGTATGLAH